MIRTDLPFAGHFLLRSAIACVQALVVVLSIHVQVHAADSIWVKVSPQSGRLLYLMDDRGDRIMDYSTVGYMGGLVPLPNYADIIPTNDGQNRIVTVGAPDSDAHQNLLNIQAAIAAVAAKPLLANGYRGVVQIPAGAYTIDGTISITTSGIILRGVGDGTNAASNTILKSTVTDPWNR